VSNQSLSSWPKITIITPCFQAGKTIEQTILSIKDQGYPNLEYIVMDGGSQDETTTILRKHADIITHWESGPDDGQYDAIQKGFARSTGEILCWLNADDMLLPRALWVVAEVFQTFDEVEWLSTLKPGGWDARGHFTGTWSVPGFSRDAFLDGLNLPSGKKGAFCIQQESTFWRRRLWEKAGAGIPEEYRLAGDFALWALFYQHADLYGLEYPVGGFRFIEGQRSQDIQSYTAEANSALQEMRSSLQWKNGIRTLIFYHKAFRFLRKRSRFRRNYGYCAAKIVKTAPNSPNGRWAMHRYRFIP
jgi:glycosyltransferase involved in cell wall biosynthesis